MDRTRTDMDFTLPPDLVTAHAASLRALARSLALDEHAADDVVQETWLRALSSPPAHHDGIGGWLRRVAEGFALKRHRSESRRADRERKYALERPEAVTSANARAETLRVVVDAVLSLEDPYRETVLLRWFEGLPPRDIAVRTKTSVATVNSRLQRAHATLRERLSRSLGHDDRRLQGVLLAIFGTSTAETAAAASISLFGVTMTTTNLMIAGGLAAAGVCTVLYFSGGQSDPRPPEIAKVVAPLAQTSKGEDVTKPDVVAQRTDASAPRSAAPPSPSSFGAASTPVGPYEFDLTVLPIDSHGRPVPQVPVRIGLELQRLAALGSTGWDGELHATWRGFEPALDLVLELSGSGGSALRKVHLAAGRPATISFAVDPRSGNFLRASGVAKLDVQASAERKKSVERLSALGYAGASWKFPGAPKFTKDEAGNGVFQDPWVVNANADPAKSAAAMGGRIDEIRKKESAAVVGRFSATKEMAPAPKIPDSAQLEGVVRDEHGDPLPGILVTALTESDAGKWETTTDTSGRFSYAVPHGKVIVLAGGGDRSVPRQDIELAADETRALDIQCAKLATTRVRLLDEEKHPLAGWRIEGRQARADQLLTGRGDTDNDGIAALVLAERPHRLLFVRPSAGALVPKLMIEDSSLGSDGDVVLRGSTSTGQIYAAFLADHGEPVEARLWRADSKEGMRMPLVDVSGGEDAAAKRELVRATDLLPGEYVIEFGAQGVPWKRVGPFYLQPGQELDAGTYTLDHPADVTVESTGGSDVPIVTARARVQGLWLEGQAASASHPAHMTLMPGEWSVSVQSSDKAASKTLLGARTVKAESGREVVLDLGAAGDPH